MRLIIHDYAGHPFQVQLSRQLSAFGHDVIHAYAGGLLTPRGALQRKPDDPKGFSVMEIPMHPDYKRDKYRFLKRRGMEVAYGRSLAAVINQVRPELVISANTPTEPQFVTLKSCESLKIPLVSWVQDFYSLAVLALARKKLPVVGVLVGKYYEFLERNIHARSAGAIAITEDFVPLLLKQGLSRDRIRVIPNWAPLDELPTGEKCNIWSRKHGLDQSFCFLYSGTLAMKHNPDLLRRIAMRFKDDPLVKVVVISEGPGTDWLAKVKESDGLDNLVLLPFQDFKDMPSVMASGDVLVTILEREAGVFSVPSKVLSYHCAGRALLGAIPQENLAARMISANKAGLVVEPDDGVGFIKCAERLYHESDFRALCAANARAYAEQHFDISKLARQFETFFVSLLRAHDENLHSRCQCQ